VARRAPGGVITVEPMANMPVIRDLVVDMDAVHWKKIGRVQPWLTPVEPAPEREYLVEHERMVDLTQAQACIQCGACVSSCLSLEVDPGFVGPAALAKAFRFVADPREAGARDRLLDLTTDPHGLYDCTHCFACIDACPKGVEPMNQIMRLRRTANSDFGIVDPNNGHRHEQGFVDNVRANGLLHEADLMADSFGGKLSPAWWREAVSSVPVVLTAVRRGKVTLDGIRHAHRRRFRGLGRLFDAVLGQPERHELNLYVSGTDDDPSPPASASTGTAADAAAGASGPNPRRAL
jgi:succinate dehydrogenase / fumarate reductase iron-sulfur subunit